jgi:cytochrome b561
MLMQHAGSTRQTLNIIAAHGRYIMTARITPVRYGSISIGLHWAMLLLLAGTYALIELREFYPKGSDMREGMKSLHFMLGLLVFVLVWFRLVTRLFGSPAPAIRPEPAAWQGILAKLVHVALYVFMIGMPLCGWLILSAAGKPVPFFGLVLPPLMGPDKEFAHFLKEIHEAGGTIGYGLIGVHAMAALFHHYFLRDNTLRRMLPAGAA